MRPEKPNRTDPFAEAFLMRLQDAPAADAFILGGYFALKHYVDYRNTNDVDAWWTDGVDVEALEVARRAFAETAAQFGYVMSERPRTGTVSLEAFDGNLKTFSFQVSIRTLRLEDPLPSPWGRFKIETLHDNVASKMMALVSRGAPRDFMDIKTLVDANVVSADACWSLWERKSPGIEREEAKQRVRLHLEMIEARRPLERLPEERRESAKELRAWFKDSFTMSRNLDLTNENRCDKDERQL